MSPKPASVAPGGLAPSPLEFALKPVGPAPIPPLAKKETAKVGGANAPTKVLPQATVQFKRPAPSTSKSVSTNAPLVVPKQPMEEATAADVNPILGAVALVFALAALGLQILMMLDYKAP